MNKSNLHISDEVGKLQKVLIHRPDDGIESVTPANAVELLYEDIVYLPKMQEEHDYFTNALRYFIGKENVLDIQDLLGEILADHVLAEEAIQVISQIEKISKKDVQQLAGLSPEVLSKTLITGTAPYKAEPVFRPLPNFIFTRDIGTIINEKVLIAHAAKLARVRESILCRFIFYNHPLFKNHEKVDISGNGINFIKNIRHKLKPMSLEGGDIMMISPEHLLMASSERTTKRAIKKSLELLFEQNAVEKITHIEMPKVRYCMHLDTIMTKISKDEFVAFAPLVMEKDKLKINSYQKNKNIPRHYASLEKLLKEENKETNFIPCADGNFPFDEREQWTDGCNLFMVNDGVGFTYDRNLRTNEALKKHGYKIIQVETILEQFRARKILAEKLRNTIITLPSSELSRARGGPHCLTMPLVRIS